MPDYSKKKILIIRLSAIGDVLRTLPAFRVLQKQYPGAYFAWAVERPSQNILEAQPYIDEVIVFPKEELKKALRSPGNVKDGLRVFWMFIRELRKKQFDLVFDFHGLFKSGIISFLSGAPERVGFSKTSSREGNFLFNNRRYPLDNDRISRIERNLTLLQKMGLSIDHDPPVLHVRDKDRKAVAAFFQKHQIDAGRPIVAIHPGTSPTTPYKRWEPYRYAVVADKIVEHHAARILFTWAGREIEMVEEIRGLMKYRSVVAPETTTLSQLAELYRNSSIYLGSDTGPMHLAALVGTPVVALFGPTDYIVNEPYSRTPHIIVRSETKCSPCRKKECSKRDCMKNISVDMVFQSVGIMLDSLQKQ